MKAFYREPQQFAYNFQHEIAVSYFKRLCLLCSDDAVRERQRRGVTAIIVMERSFFSNRWVFTELAYKRGYLTREHYEHLAYFFELCIKGWKHFPPMDAVFLLRAPVHEVNCCIFFQLQHVTF